jgi:hypothetical protein
MGEVLSTAQARAAGLGKQYPDTTAGNALLDERIVSVERWLASRIGPLLGPIVVETLNLNGGARVWLRRRAADGTLAVTLDGDAVTAELFVTTSGELVRADGEFWHGRVRAEWTPDDEAAVREALIKLLRLELTETGMQSETISGSSYAYQRARGGTDQRDPRDEVVLSLLPYGAGLGA